MAGCEADARVAESLSFPPSARLRQPKEYAAVLASSQRCRSGSFEVRFKANDGPGRARLGLVIPKRLARRAVLRNLIKRLARESFRQRARSLPAVDIVLRLSAPAGAGRADDRQRRLWRAQIEGLLALVPARLATPGRSS